MRVCFYTLGCKVNLNETGALEQMFRGAGFTIVPEGEEADVFVVNSCTVTNFGDQKSRKWLRRAKRENPDAVTVLTGCYPQAFPEEAAQFMEADLVCGNGDRKAILDNVLKLLDGHERIVAVTPHQRGELFEELPVERFETHTRAFIKVEDGCNRQCAYCVIPRARGPVRSRAEDSILKELRQLAASGYREVVLSAISLPSYGLDTGTNLVELVEKCAQVEGIERIRLGSLDPDMLTPEFITRLAAVEKLCPQFHRLGGHLFRDVQGHQDFPDLPVPPAHQKARVVKVHLQPEGGHGVQIAVDLRYRAHASNSFCMAATPVRTASNSCRQGTSSGLSEWAMPVRARSTRRRSCSSRAGRRGSPRPVSCRPAQHSAGVRGGISPGVTSRMV